MSRVRLVGGLLLGSTAGVTLSGRRAVDRAELVIFPGDWTGPELEKLAGRRLRAGREIGLKEVLSAAREHSNVAILFSGSPYIATGRGTSFPTAQELRRLLELDGHDVSILPGVSSVQAAADAARLDLCTSGCPSHTVVSLESLATGIPALATAASSDAVVTLIWFEDHAERAVSALIAKRGPVSIGVLVQNLGRDVSVEKGTLADLRRLLIDLPPPAVLFSFPPSPGLPAELVQAAGRWVTRLSSGIHWLTGPPQAGKSAWLMAVGEAAPDVRTVDMEGVLDALWSDVGTRADASAARAFATEALRSIGWSGAAPVLVETAYLPEGVLNRPSGLHEQVHVLLPDEDDWHTRRRACRNGVDDAEPTHSAWSEARRIGDLPAVRTVRPPHAPALVGRVLEPAR